MDGRLSGEAFVVLESQEALQAAMALDKQKLGNRCVRTCVSVWVTVYAHMVSSGIRRTDQPNHISTRVHVRWLDLFESHPGELFSRVGAAVVIMTETNDAGYKGVVKMRGLPFQATVGEVFQMGKGIFVHPLVITD